MFEFRGIETIFKNAINTIPNTANLYSVKLLNSYQNQITQYNELIYDDLTVNACISTIARHVSKLRPVHILSDENGRTVQNSNINTLLTHRPNEFMTSTEFLYKITSQLLLYGNAFVWIKKNKAGFITGFYPLTFSNCELKEYKGELCLKFQFHTGQTEVIFYDEIIHLRHNYINDDILGQQANNSLKPTLENLYKARQSIANKVQNSGNITGILKLAGNQKAADWYENALSWAKKFKNYSSETGGIAAIDSSVEFQPIDLKVESVEDSQLKFLQNEVYSYFGLTENIISGNYTEQEWQAFYESVIDPIKILLSQEFTAKIFNDTEYKNGNYIDFNSNRLSYASTTNKVAMVKELGALGLLTINESREIFDLPPVENGEKRLVSLNYVNADKADEYQLKD